MNGNGVDLRGVSPNSRKVVLARRDSVVRSEVTRFRNKPYSILNLDEKEPPRP